MKASTLEISGLLLIELEVRGDARGFFVERYQQEKFRALGLPDRFLQDNHFRSRSKAGKLRAIPRQARVRFVMEACEENGLCTCDRRGSVPIVPWRGRSGCRNSSTTPPPSGLRSGPAGCRHVWQSGGPLA